MKREAVWREERDKFRPRPPPLLFPTQFLFFKKRTNKRSQVGLERRCQLILVAKSNVNVLEMFFTLKTTFASLLPLLCYLDVLVSIASNENQTLFFFHPANLRGITSREVYQEFQPSDDIFRRSGAKGWLFRRQVPSTHPQPTLPNC